VDKFRVLGLCLLFLVSCSAQETTYLIESAKMGNLTQVKGLLEAGADINAKDGFQRTALHWAVNRGFKPIARLLIEKGANVNAKDRDAFTPLHLASQLVQSDVAELLIQHGAELNAKENSWGKTPLHFVSQFGPESMAALLIEKGADIHVRDNLKLTPLHYAAVGGHKGIAELLIAKGADVKAEGLDPFTRQPGVTPIHLADSPEMREFLQSKAIK
jgi:ankyrin repeat protein